MAAIDDVNAALAKMATSITNLQAGVAAENADITAALAVITNPNSTDVQLAAATQAITTAAANIDSLTAGVAAQAATIKTNVPTAP